MPQRTFASIRKSKEKGIAVYLTAFFLLAMIPIVGLAIDGGFAFVIRTRLSAAGDAAALAAGRGINLSGTIAQAQTQATTQATNFFNANFPPGYMNTATGSTRVITPTFTVNLDANNNPTGVLSISMFVQVQAPTYFMKMLGIPYLTINDTGTATRRNLVMELVLDTSASMTPRPAADVGHIPATLLATDVPCQALVYSTAQFITYFSPYDTLGDITFDATVYDDNGAGTNNGFGDGSYTASTNYGQSGAGGMAHSIANIQCGSNTNTEAALYKAYQDIKTVNQKLAQNVIVLFTDGVPNAVNAQFPVRTKVDSRYSPAPGACIPGLRRRERNHFVHQWHTRLRRLPRRFGMRGGILRQRGQRGRRHGCLHHHGRHSHGRDRAVGQFRHQRRQQERARQDVLHRRDAHHPCRLPEWRHWADQPDYRVYPEYNVSFVHGWELHD